MTDLVFETEHGAAIRCGCCGRHLHLLFGNALMVVDLARFEQFRASLAEFTAEDALMATPLGCRIILRAAWMSSAYMFTREELAEFRQLVDGTGLMLELEAH